MVPEKTLRRFILSVNGQIMQGQIMHTLAFEACRMFAVLYIPYRLESATAANSVLANAPNLA